VNCIVLLLFIMDFDDDEEDYLDFELFEHICVTRTIRDRSNPLIDFSDEEFRVRFRLRKDTVIAILSEIEHDLSYPSGEKNNSVSPLNQLLIALRFYATSTFQVDNLLVYSRVSSRIQARLHRPLSRCLAMLGAQSL